MQSNFFSKINSMNNGDQKTVSISNNIMGEEQEEIDPNVQLIGPCIDGL